MDSIGGGCSAFTENMLREDAGRFDISRIVEQHQRLLRRVGAGTFGRAFLAAGGVKSHQTRMQEASLPPRVQAAAIETFAVVMLPLACREVEIVPVAFGLIRFDRWP